MVSVSVRRVFQKNTKQLLKQKEVFTWPHVLRDLRVKTGRTNVTVKSERAILYIYMQYGAVPLLLFCIGRYLAVGKPFEGSVVAEQAQWTTGMASSPRFFDAEAHGTRSGKVSGCGGVIRLQKDFATERAETRGGGQGSS